MAKGRFTRFSSPKGSFKSWITKLSQGPVKFVIGYRTRPEATLVYTKEKKKSGDHGVRGSRKTSFFGLHYLLTWSNRFCRGRGKRGALVEKGKSPWQRNDVIIYF